MLSAVVASRLSAFEALAAEWRAASHAAAQAVRVRVRTPRCAEAAEVAATSFVTTPAELVRDAGSFVVCTVDGAPWDVHRPLPAPRPAPLEVEFHGFDSELGWRTMQHSAAHVLGLALEARFGPQLLLLDGPALDANRGGTGPGFFYDSLAPEPLREDVHLPELEALCAEAVRARHRFEVAEVPVSAALDLFAYNPYKVDVLRGLDAERVSLYRSGDLVDLCRGPHIAHTGLLKGFALTSVSSLHSDGGGERHAQRVYGVAFPDRKKLKTWRTQREEAQARDHRRVGRQQGLFMFHDVSPGSAFFLPHGTLVYNRLVQFMRDAYARRGYAEVRTPLLYRRQLWEQSGHWDNYKEHMFTVRSGRGAADSGEAVGNKEEFGLKPMNCPGHCLMFAAQLRSYRDLPVRLADFSSLHRDEDSGTLTGLTRVRRFCQDDAHVFCAEADMRSELVGVLDFVAHVYSTFGLTFRMRLATRPTEKSLGDDLLWTRAEETLREVLSAQEHEWEVDEGGGAFYGPKVDVVVRDSMGREHQLATVQLDFQLPRRFDLQFKNAQGEMETPVMIHRAIFGSLERFMALLVEHTGGKWPFWLSPRQCIVNPVSERFLAYARNVAERLREDGRFAVDLNESDNSVRRKIRDSQAAQYNYILVVGADEEANGTVSVRARDTRESSTMTVQELQNAFHELDKHKDERATHDLHSSSLSSSSSGSGD